MDLDKSGVGLGNKPALVVVDAIKGFTDPDCPLGHQCDSAMAQITALADAFTVLNLPVVYTTVVYDDDVQASVFRTKLPALNLLKRELVWHEFDPRLNLKPNDLIIEKHWASAFFGTALAGQLTTQTVDSLVVTGFTTSGCVRATAVDGLQHNFRVVVAEDACSDRNQAAHDANLFDLGAKYTDVCATADILKSLARR